MKPEKEISPVIDLNAKRETQKLRKRYPCLKADSLDKAAKIYCHYLPKKELESIIPYLEDSDPLLRNIAHDALTYFSGRDFGKNPHQWLRWWRISKQNFST